MMGHSDTSIKGIRMEMATLDYIVFCIVIFTILWLLLTIYEARTNRQSYLLRLHEVEKGSARDS